MKSKEQRSLLIPVIGLIIYFSLFRYSLAGIPNHNPIPGGVAVIALSGLSGEKPSVRFGDKKVHVIRKDFHWIAVVGLPQDILPGKYILTFDAGSGSQAKKSFRIEPVPPSKTQRTVELPENLYSLEFDAMNSKTHKSFIDDEQEFDDPLQPEFIFHQIINSGSYLPYGWLLKEKSSKVVIDHPWITYITQQEEIVSAPAAAIVEQIYLSDSSGLTVILNHGNGMKSFISHLNDTILKPGESIETGDIIGTTKNTENLSIGRVDWQLMLNGYFIDPLQFSSSP